MWCAGGGESSTRISTWVVVSSHGVPEDLCDTPTDLARVAPAQDWIRKVFSYRIGRRWSHLRGGPGFGKYKPTCTRIR